MLMSESHRRTATATIAGHLVLEASGAGRYEC
jgi:hypothetical protein